MKKIITLFLLTLFLISASAQNTINVEKADKHIEIPGIQISIIPPTNFEKSSQFIGFQDMASGSSIMIMQIPGPYHELRKAFTKDHLQIKGMELIYKNDVLINTMAGELIQVRQFSPTHGYNFLKYTLLLSLDQNNSLLINGNYPESKKEYLDNLIKESLLSIYYDKNLKIDPFASLDYTVDLSKSKFKLRNSISGTIMLDAGENGIMIIAKSIRPVNASDKKGASIQILKAISTINYQNLDNSKEIKIDDSEGYQIVANVIKNAKPFKALQTILFGDHYYYNFTAIVPQKTNEILTDYEYILSSFKRK